MAPVKVIVQGIPLPSADSKNSEDPTNDKIKLEKLFEKFGPVKCQYLWSDKAAHVAESPCKRRRVIRNEGTVDNFAHILFKNDTDAARACEAADNREITFENSVLTLTAVLETSKTINDLDDFVLIKIFSLLDKKQRLQIEEVCKRWKEVAKSSWSDVEDLSLQWEELTDEEYEKYLSRCGQYLKRFTCMVDSPFVPNLILKHCKQLESLDLETNWRIEGEESLIDMFIGLTKLKSLTLAHRRLLEFRFLQCVPKSIEEISFFCSSSYNRPFSFDLRKFKNVHTLSLRGYVLYGEEVDGIETMSNLTELDLGMCTTYRLLTRKFQMLTKLKTLRIPQSGITDEILIHIIQNNPELEHLDARALTDRSIRLASTLPHLEELNVSVAPNVSLKHMNRMPLLESLTCQECDEITDETVINLIELSPSLRWLDVGFTSVTPAVFEMVNAAVKKRTNDVTLSFETSYPRDESKIPKNLSPLLHIVWDGCRGRSVYGDNNYGPPKALNDEGPDEDSDSYADESDGEIFDEDDDEDDDEDGDEDEYE